MIDICFSNSVGGLLNLARGLIDTDYILPLFLELNRGDISGDIIAAQQKLYIEGFMRFYPKKTLSELEEMCVEEDIEPMQKCYDRLINFLKEGHTVRVWVSNTARDRCGLYWLSKFIKPYVTTVNVVTCPGYEYDAKKKCYIENRNWSTFRNYYFLAECAKDAVELTKPEIEHYSQMWDRLVEENAPLRILVDDYILGVNEDFFDSIILANIDKTPKTQSKILAETLIKTRGINDDYISMRIDHHIKMGTIVVVEDREDEMGGCWPRTLCLA